ncbi:DUF2141 domain-containing protein [Jannaschia rubra]|uniref:DUF2141 domain-containing protein n=1 Tax=Jannaschia rubra TaxID=282197 RepID=A0A0M6XWB1_9RHOB|nr:DUF2141 domain-containing protein [Jannaschia rubra]CTQ34583.1 hypothetical protein JAN5088_03379 [Jannaschia rubra]SFG72610.1 Uncharacterized conserved protein, DUF2141 family [Jannaschia rubra]
MHTILTLSLLTVAVPAVAADLRVEIANLRSTEGQILVAACDEARFTTADCPFTARAPASEGAATIRGLPPGIYAVQAIHDENANDKLDRRLRLLPLEGLGFSRDAPMRRGPPRFGDAALAVEGDGTITVNMRYFQ